MFGKKVLEAKVNTHKLRDPIQAKQIQIKVTVRCWHRGASNIYSRASISQHFLTFEASLKLQLTSTWSLTKILKVKRVRTKNFVVLS